MIDKKYLDEIRAIHPKLFSKIRKAGTKTGSKVFGGWAEGHDIDFIMPPGFSPSWKEVFGLGVLAYELVHDDDTDYTRKNSELALNYWGDDFRSGYMKTDAGTILNLLWMETEEAYRIWTQATAILKDMVEKYPQIAERMEKKKFRIGAFENLKEMLE